MLLAVAALWLEWWLYYSAREQQRVAEVQEALTEAPLPEFDQELEEQENRGFRNPNFVRR